MNQSIIIIRYGEIALKAEYTRQHFIQQLTQNIKNALSQEDITGSLELKRGRIFLHTKDIKKSIQVLKRIFGIVSMSPVWPSSANLSVLTDDVIGLMDDLLDAHTTFALRVRRSGSHNYTSQDAAVHIGQAVCNRFHVAVDLDNPDLEIFIEIRDEKAFLFTEKIQGVGGLPYGTQGAVLCIVQSSKDILAAWFLMKRGCKIRFVSINPQLFEQIKGFLNNLYIKNTPSLFKHFSDVKEYDFLKKEISKSECKAICLGLICKENEVKILQEIDEFKNKFFLPVLTPLIGMTEEEYKKKAKQVGLI